MFRWMTAIALGPLTYDKFIRIPKWMWFTFMGASCAGGISMMAFFVVPSAIEGKRLEIVEAVLPGCWQLNQEHRIAFFYERKTRESMSRNIVYLYQLESDEAIEFLASRGITSASPRLTEMYVDRRRPPWTFEMENGDSVTVEPIIVEPFNSISIRVEGNDVLPTGVWSRCDPQPQRNWQFRVRRYA